MTQFIKMYDTVFSNFKYKNDTIYKNVCHNLNEFHKKIYYNYI